MSNKSFDTKYVHVCVSKYNYLLVIQIGLWLLPICFVCIASKFLVVTKGAETLSSHQIPIPLALPLPDKLLIIIILMSLHVLVPRNLLNKN